MSNKKNHSSDLNEMQQAALEVCHERQWDKYHTPKNMAMDLVREASEVLEHLIWPTNREILKDKARLAEIKDEMGDVLHALLLLADSCGIDTVAAFWDKLEKTKLKYPKDEVNGLSGYDFKRAKKTAK